MAGNKQIAESGCRASLWESTRGDRRKKDASRGLPTQPDQAQRIEEHFSLGMTVRRIWPIAYRGFQSVDQHFKLTMTASNLVRMARILSAAPQGGAPNCIRFAHSRRATRSDRFVWMPKFIRKARQNDRRSRIAAKFNGLLDRGEKANSRLSRTEVACSEAEWRVILAVASR